VTQLRGELRLLESGERADGVDAAWSIEQARLLYQLGVAEIRAADPNADASFRRASAAVRRSLRAGGHPEAAELVARIALARHGDAIPADTIDRDRVAAIEEALGLLDETELRLRAELLAHKAILHCWAPDRTLVARLSRDAVEAAERCGDEEALFRALDGQQISLWNDPDAGKRLAILDRMQAIAARRGDPRQLHWCYYWRAVALAEQGRLTDADVEIEAQERIAERLREPHRRYLPAYLRAMRALLDGDRDRALALADQAFALGERAGVPDAPTIRAGIRIRAIFEEGGPLEGALAVMNTWPPERSPRGLEAVRALFLAESGEREKARALVDEIVAGDLAAIPREPNWVSVLVVLADAVAVTGAVEHAPVLRRHLEPYDGRLAIPGMGTACMGLVTRSLAQLAVLEERWDDAIAAFEAATRQAQQMGARAWLAILRVDHGLALVARTRAQGAAGDRLATATALLEQGRADAEALGMARVESMARRALEELGARRAGAPRRSPAAARPVARCRREGRNWSLSFEDVSVRVPDSKGMRYLAELFGRAGDAVHAIELELVANGSDPKAGPTLEQGLRVQMGVGSTDAALDARALREIRARLAVLRETIERAEQLNDLDRASRTREEIDFLTQQLAISVGLGGRRRRDGGDAAERARLRVTQRIKATLQALRGVHPALANHLARSVQTGVLCSYAPVPDDSPIWEL